MLGSSPLFFARYCDGGSLLISFSECTTSQCWFADFPVTHRATSDWIYGAGKRLGPSYSPPSGGNFGMTGGVVKGVVWADSGNGIPMHGFTQDGVSSRGPCSINCTNNNETYSFHSGGARCVLGDTAVRLSLSRSISTPWPHSLLRRGMSSFRSKTTLHDAW